jgi:hypothetical protein
MPRLAGPATLVAAGVLIVGFVLNADVWDSQSHFGPRVLTADQALPPERDDVRVEPRRKPPAAVSKQRPAGSEPRRSGRVQRQSETAVTSEPQPDVRLRPTRQVRTARSSRAQRPVRRARAKVDKTPITASPPAAPVAPPPESTPPVTPPPPAAGGPTASASPPVSPPPSVAPVSPAPRVPVTGAAPPLRALPDATRLPAANPVVPASDEDGDEPDPDDRADQSGFEAVEDTERDAEDAGFGAGSDDDDSEEDEDDGGDDD